MSGTSGAGTSRTSGKAAAAPGTPSEPSRPRAKIRPMPAASGGASSGPTSGSGTSGSGTSGSGTSGTSGAGADTRATLELAHAAITRRDGTACRAVLAQLPATLADRADNERAIQARAFCEMTAGNCDGGLRMFVDQFPMPAAGAQVIADMYCSPGNDPVIRLRRLVVQTTRRRVDQLACAYYVPFARAARQVATSDDDKRTVAGVLGTLGRCFSTHGQCDEARGLAGEANTLDPRVDARAELAAACRP